MNGIKCYSCKETLPLGDFMYSQHGVLFATKCDTCNIAVFWQRTYCEMALASTPKAIEAPQSLTDFDTKFLKDFHISMEEQ